MGRGFPALSIAIVLFPVLAYAQADETIAYRDLVEISAKQQYASVRPDTDSAIALHFKLKDTWHFYADEETAPGRMNLKINPEAEGVEFGDVIFPPSKSYFDKSSNLQLKAFSDEFTVYLLFSVAASAAGNVEVRISFDGAVCSQMQCQLPSFKKLITNVNVSADAAMEDAAFQLPVITPQPSAVEADGVGDAVTVYLALPLAIFAGLILNIMPCVWPVIPIIVMRLLEQAKHSRARSVALGLAFSGGIILFFVAMAVVNIALRVGFDTVFQWGDHFRNPAFLIAMVLLMVVLAMFMFGVFSIGIPASVAGRAGSGKGFAGSVVMGFLAAVLATPCSFAILTVAFAWAQTQQLFLSTVAILLIGVGMALPYLVLTSIPKLLERIPKPGRWMDFFKQALGFVLLVIAVKLLSALPDEQKIATLYCCAVFAFSVWMWGTWVTYSTAKLRKWITRTAAVVISVIAGFTLLPQQTELIDWRDYDAAVINEAVVEKKPVLIEFMADWCLSCKTVEKTVYNRKDIADLIEQKGVLAVRADTTLRDYPATIDLKDIYREPAVPVTILLLPGQKDPAKLRGIMIRNSLVEHLDKLPDKEP